MKQLSTLLIAAAFITLLGACDRPHPKVVTEEPKRLFTYTFSNNVTPLERAAERYSDFKYHIRKAGENEFSTFLPQSVKPTRDGSVVAEFKIAIPEPKLDERFEIQTSYTLDGKLHKPPISEKVLRATAKQP